MNERKDGPSFPEEQACHWQFCFGKGTFVTEEAQSLPLGNEDPPTVWFPGLCAVGFLNQPVIWVLVLLRTTIQLFQCQQSMLLPLPGSFAKRCPPLGAVVSCRLADRRVARNTLGSRVQALRVQKSLVVSLQASFYGQICSVDLVASSSSWY